MAAYAAITLTTALGGSQRSALRRVTVCRYSLDRVPSGREEWLEILEKKMFHPAGYNGYRVSFPGVKRGADNPPLTNAEVKERVELYIYSPSWPSWPFLGRNVPLPCPAGIANPDCPAAILSYSLHPVGYRGI